MKGSSTRKHAK